MRGILPNNGNDSIQTVNASAHAIVSAGQRVQQDTVPGITAQALLEQERKLRKEAHAAYTRELEKLQAELETVCHEKLSFANLAKEAEDQLEEERELRAETQEELKKLSDKNLLLENEINKFNGILDEVLTMQEKAQDSLRKIPTKRLQMEGYMSCFTVFSHSELANATKQFDPSLKIADGNQGPVYRAHLRSMMVAVKVIEERTISGFSLFPTVRRKIDATNPGMRHPNLLSPIGGCEEPMALVYEYLPNGSLRDQLTSDAGAKRLTWEIRTRIVTEISSALIFLHSAGAANGDLKPTHILLDANFSVKIISFATKPDSYDVSYAQHCDIRQLGRIILILLADSRELSPYFCGKSSVFKRHMEMVNEIENAVRTKNVESIVDKRAGEWPKAVALKLATLCLECYRVSGDDDVDLESHVQSILSAPKGQEPPSYFICPITQEMMKDPQVAADGFTYEREALMKWFDDGHKTSPMTNENLEHLKLTPNHALRSAIQQWLQEYSNFT